MQISDLAYLHKNPIYTTFYNRNNYFYCFKPNQMNTTLEMVIIPNDDSNRIISQ